MLSSFLLLAVAQSSAPTEAFLRDPDIHGDQIAFTCEGDIWLGDLSSGRATRLTRGEGREEYPRFSPDGKWIAFSGEYGGMQDVYVVPVGGGAPRQVTFQNDYARMLDWSPDGKSLYYRSRNVPRSFALYRIPVEGGFPVKMPLEVLSSASWAPDGNRFVFTRLFRSDDAWFRYRGGAKNDLWLGDEKALSFKKIVSTQNTNEYPVWTEKGICFVEDDDGKFSVKAVNADGSNSRRIAGPYDVEVRFLNTDGKRLIYERGVGLEILDLASGKPQPVKMELASDLSGTLPFLVSADAQMMAGNIGPTGRRVLVETRGQIVSLPAKEGDARVLIAKDGVRYRYPLYSPDGKKVAYFGDETREMQLYVADADGSNPKQITKDSGRQLVRMQWSPDGKRIGLVDSNSKLRLVEADGSDDKVVMTGTGWNGPNFDFSPDSKWIVYQGTQDITYFGFLGLYEIATGKHTKLGSGMHNDMAPTFSSDGKYIAFISARNISPRNDPVLDQLITESPARAYLLALSRETRSPLLPETADEGAAKPEEKKPEGAPDVRIDLDNLYERIIEVPAPPSNYSKVAMVGDRVILHSETTTTFYDLKAKRGGTVTSGGAWFDVSDDKKKLLIGPRPLRVLDVTAENVNTTDGGVNWGNLQLRINPVKEWENMYWDGWRLLRDYFYVENMHGADWDAVGKKYARYLPLLRSRYELNELLRWMQSELNTSHMYLSDGDMRRLTQPASPGHLGVDLKPGPNGYYQIVKIFRGDGFNTAEASPLAATGLNVKEGDYLIEVAGRPAKVGENFMQGLVNRAGQVVNLKVNDKPSAEGARTILIRPAAAERPMRYREWVKDRREYVAKASGGKIGYIHLQSMVQSDFADFIKQYYPQRDRDALIVDVRYNTGGYISSRVISILRQKAVLFFNHRSNPMWTRQQDFFLGPMAAITNEFSYSNGEEFPHHFKALKLGPLIGKRTMGGEVGSSPGWPLVDGGRIQVPNYGAWTPENGWEIEATGVAPDIEVENDPNEFAKGKDPQLDRAVTHLLEQLRKNPVKRPTVPKDPIR